MVEALDTAPIIVHHRSLGNKYSQRLSPHSLHTRMSPEPDRTIDRRPLAARQLVFAQRSAAWLAQRRISPNAISIAGLVAGIAAGAALSCTRFVDGPASSVLWLIAAVLVQIRLLMNMLDGMVAIKSLTVSPMGELYNEIPDRVSDAATLIGLGYAAGGSATLGYIAACLAMFVAYIRAAGRVAGSHQEYCGPMAKPQRMFVVTLVAVYCGLMPTHWLFGSHSDSPWRAPAIALSLIIVGCIVTAVRRLTRIRNVLTKAPP